MLDLKHIYMTVTMDVLNTGFNFCCWMTTERLWLAELQQYPNDYTVEQGGYLFHIHCNQELTHETVMSISGEAESILYRQRAINAKRKLANR